MGQGFSSAFGVLADVGVEEKRGILPVPGKIPEGKNIMTFYFLHADPKHFDCEREKMQH